MLALLGWFATPPAIAQAAARVYRIGILRGETPDNVRVWDGFFADLRKFGYIEGANLVVERREYKDVTRDPALLAAELAALRVDVIVAGATPAAEAAKRATSTIPIVMTAHPDPVGSGLAASLARPGGNVTGLSVQTKDLRGKQLQLLKELVPDVRRVAVFQNLEIPAHGLESREIEAAGPSLGIAVVAVQARSVQEFAAALAAALRERAGAMIVLGGAVYFANRHELVSQVARSRIPAIYGFGEFADAGGLIAYGPSLPESYRRAAWYVDRILRGARPQDLAIEQASQFELVVNLGTARALGIVVPRPVLERADRVIP